MNESLAKAVRRALVLAVVLEAACGGSHAGSGTGGHGGGGASGTSGGGGAGTSGGGGAGTSGGGVGGTGSPDASSDGKSGAGGGSGADGSTSDAGASEVPSCAPGGPGRGNCGASHESCCTSLLIAGGAYARTYDVSADGGADASAEAGTDPATVADFRLDKYDVTVGRFRQFVSAVSPGDGGVGWRPAPGTGKHAHLNGGLGLLDVGAPADAGVTHEPGWVAADDGNIAPTNANLSSCGANSTWTAAAGAEESFPINCVTWWEAYAFCIWDGGFLPSEAEWEYAAAGGSRELPYPWGATAPGTMNRYAIYDCDYPDGTGICASATNIAPVGTATAGAGAWGQLDLAGNMWQWNLDWYAPYVSPCTDCARATKGSSRVLRGGGFGDAASNLRPTYRNANDPAIRNDFDGIRCARSP